MDFESEINSREDEFGFELLENENDSRKEIFDHIELRRRSLITNKLHMILTRTKKNLKICFYRNEPGKRHETNYYYRYLSG